MRSSTRKPPRGLALILVVACLAVMALVFVALVKIGMTEKAQARAEERRLRALWLAESGLERAWAKLGTSPGYRGETWELSAETLRGRDAARIRIEVEPVEGKPALRRVTARADLPREGALRVRQTRTVEMILPDNASGDVR